MVPVGRSGAGGGGSGRSGCSLAFLDLESLSGVSGMNVPGSDCSLCSLEGALVGVRLLKTPRILGARHVLVVGRSGGRSVSEVCCAAALATALFTSRQASGSISTAAVSLWSSSESVSRSPGRRCVVLPGVSAEPGVRPGVGSFVVGSGVSYVGSTEGRL